MKLLSLHVRYSLAMALLVVLPGCGLFDSFKNKSTATQDSQQSVTVDVTGVEMSAPQTGLRPVQGEVLVSVQGIPVVTVESLQAEKDKLFAANPQLKGVMAFMDPTQLDMNLLEGLTNQIIVDKWIVENGVADTQAYKNELQEGYKAIERMLNSKFFSESFKVAVSDADIRKLYDANKDLMPNLIVVRGGTKAMGVQFDQEQSARAFAEKVKAKRNNLSAAAQEAGIAPDNIKDFKLVNEQSVGIEDALRKAIVSMVNVPAVEVVKVNNVWWVVVASERQESQYKPFEQVKANLKVAAEKEKRTELFDQAVDRLRKEYNVVVNQDHFKSMPVSAEQDMPELTEEEIAALQDEMM